jgi:hypothetical protein
MGVGVVFGGWVFLSAIGAGFGGILPGLEGGGLDFVVLDRATRVRDGTRTIDATRSTDHFSRQLLLSVELISPPYYT